MPINMQLRAREKDHSGRNTNISVQVEEELPPSRLAALLSP
jgi:hypothetical protein